MPLHRAVDPGVEDDQPEQGQQRREEEVHVLLVDLVVKKKEKIRQRKKKRRCLFHLGIHWIVGKSHIELPVPGHLQHLGHVVHTAVRKNYWT